jgi:hypothetical protein
MNKDIWPTAAILNGLDIGAKPPQGQMVKVIR